MKTAKKYGRRYPWDEWFRRSLKRAVVLRRGEHFNGQAWSFASKIRAMAGPQRYNVSVSIRLADDGSTVTFRTRER